MPKILDDEYIKKADMLGLVKDKFGQRINKPQINNTIAPVDHKEDIQELKKYIDRVHIESLSRDKAIFKILDEENKEELKNDEDNETQYTIHRDSDQLISKISSDKVELTFTRGSNNRVVKFTVTKT